MSNKVDKLFRENLASGNFVPSSDEWAMMEKLIDADLGSSSTGASGSGISINILFTSFFVFLLSSGVILSQLDSDLNPFLNKRGNEITKLEVKNNGEAKGDDLISNSNSINSDAIDADLKEQEGSDVDPVSTRFEESNTPISISPFQNTLEEGSKIIAEEIGFAEAAKSQGSNVSVEAKQIESSQNKSTSESELKHSENKSFDREDDNSTNSRMNEAKQSNSNLSAVETNNKSKSNPSNYIIGEAQLNALSNTPNHKKGEAQLNESFDTFLSKQNQPQDNPSKKKQNFLNSNFPNLLSNSLLLSSQAITSFKDLKKLEGLTKFDGENKVFKVSPQKNRKKFPLQLSIAAFGEAAWISKKITGDPEFTSLINTRNEQEKSLLKFNAGIEFQAKYKGFGINTGFSTGNYGENVQYEEKYYSEWEVENNVLSDTLWTQEIEFIYDTVYSPIDSTWIWTIVDSMFVTVIDSIILTNQYDSTEVITPLGLTKHNGKTNVSYWEIPLYFSYQFEIDNFYLSPGLGVTFGFWKMSKAYYMAKDEQSLIPINTEYYVLKKTIINANIMLGVGYKIGDQFSLELTPSFKFNVNNIFKEDDIIQKYKSLSLQLRLRYYF